MKNVFSSFLFLLVSNFVFGQIEWVGNHIFTESAADLVRTSQNQYILAHNGLTVFDSVGNIIFEGLTNDYPDAEGAFFSDIVEMADSSIVFSSGWGECDIIVGIVTKYDKHWNELWTENNDFVVGPSANFSDNSFIVSSWSSIERWSAAGTKLWSDFLSGIHINDLVVTPADTVLLATEQGLLKMTAEGTIVDSFPNLIFKKIELLPNGNYLMQYNDVLNLYTPNLTQLAFFQQPGDAFLDLAISQNEIAVLTSVPKVVRLDLTLSQIGATLLSGHNQTFTSVAYADGGVMLAGSEEYGNDLHGNQSTFIKEFALNGATANTAIDVALTQANHGDSITVTKVFNLFTITIPSVEVTVKNLSSTVLESVNINFYWPDAQGFPCPFSNRFSKNFDNLALQPGATANLAWGDLPIRTWTDFSGDQIELCFWTSLPNHHLETNNDNDVSCTQVTVATKERFTVAFSQTFNPVSDELHLEINSFIENEKTEARIFNAAGQLVHSEATTGQRQTIELAYLPDGAYFLQIVSGQRVGWGKFVKS